MKLIELFITEYKQVGTLYHFTDMQTAWVILDQMKLKKGDEGGMSTFGGGFAITQPRHGISLTRNPRLSLKSAGGPDKPWGEVRIVLDGDKLAHRYKIKPEVDWMHGITRQSDQAEEMIKKDEVDITGAIKSIDFNYNFYIKNQEWWIDREDISKKEAEKYAKMNRTDAAGFVKYIRDKNIPLNIVKRF